LSAIIVAFILGTLIFLIEKNIIMAHSNRSIKIFLRSEEHTSELQSKR
jgi:hypothetical protein